MNSKGKDGEGRADKLQEDTAEEEKRYMAMRYKPGPLQVQTFLQLQQSIQQALTTLTEAQQLIHTSLFLQQIVQAGRQPGIGEVPTETGSINEQSQQGGEEQSKTPPWLFGRPPDLQ
jgi:hypothetical protein